MSISFSQVNTLPDIMDQQNFVLYLNSIPNWGDTSGLTLKCLNASLPGVGMEKMPVPLHGHELNFRGRKTFPRTLSVSYYEDSNFDTHKALRSWNEFTVGTISGNSQGYKNEYAVDGFLDTEDTTGKVVSRYTFVNMMIEDISDTQVDGSSSAPMIVAVTFSYDIATLDLVQDL
jgi:hypothetical protein